jgi:hypothetical protein
MHVLEKEIEERVVTWAKRNDFLTPKVKFVENGYPDRLFISPNGHTIFIEFKRPGEIPEPLQVYRLKELQRRGIPAVWCDTALAAIRILQACLESEGLPETSDPTPIKSSVRGALTRPRLGQDVDGPRYDKDTESEGVGEEDSGSGTPPSDILSVAPGNPEMG